MSETIEFIEPQISEPRRRHVHEPPAAPAAWQLSPRSRTWLTALLAVGALALAVGFFVAPQRAWANLLLGNFYFLTLALCGVLFMAIHYLANAGWWVLIKRVPQALTAYLLPGALVMLALYFGIHQLYEWSHEQTVVSNPLLQGKAAYLNEPFFMARMVLFLGLWLLLAMQLEKHSLRLDATGDLAHLRRVKRYAALFLVGFGITLTFASFDWVMSLEPEWYSTIFAVYIFSGLFVSGVAAITMATLFLKSRGLLPAVNENHLQDLGKYLFGFSTFWAYIWVSQYLLMWYANIPEETVYYVRRMNSSWYPLFLGNLFVNWVIPFLLLVTRRAKRGTRVLWWASGLILAGHWLDLYLMIMPVFSPQFSLTWLEPLLLAGFAAGFILVAARKANRLLPGQCQDPYLSESLHFHQ